MQQLCFNAKCVAFIRLQFEHFSNGKINWFY